MKLDKVLEFLKELLIGFSTIVLVSFLGFKSIELLEAGNGLESGLLMFSMLFILAAVIVWVNQE